MSDWAAVAERLHDDVLPAWDGRPDEINGIECFTFGTGEGASSMNVAIARSALEERTYAECRKILVAELEGLYSDANSVRLQIENNLVLVKDAIGRGQAKTY